MYRAGATTNSTSLGFTGGLGATLVLFNSPSTAATLNVPLTITGAMTCTSAAIGAGGFTSGGNSSITGAMTCTSAAIGAGGFTSGGNSSITGNLSLSNSGTGNLYTFQSVNANATNSIIGVGNANLSSGNANSGNMIFTYVGSNNVANSVTFGLSGAGKPALQFTNNGTATFTDCTVAATPRYGIRTKGSAQTVASGGSAAITWTDSVTGPLTSNGASYINNTGGTLVVMIYYTILWDISFTGGTVAVTVRTAGGTVLTTSFAAVFSTTGSATCSGSVIHSVASTDSFYIEAFNFLGSALDLIGAGSNTCKMGYYVLN